MRVLGVLAVLLAAAPALAANLGVFKNPAGSVQVRLTECGTGLCGTIVSANAKARADAAKAGQTKLIGMQLFREMSAEPAAAGEPRRWTGKVYVPDLDKTVSGKAELHGRTLSVTGCLVAGAFCKGQDWTRIK